MRLFFPLMVIAACLLACNTKDSSETLLKPFEEGPYFRMIDSADYKILEVIHPLNHSQIERYLLTRKKNLIEKPQGFVHLVQLPLKRVACLSTSQIGFISALEEEESIVGSLNPEFNYSPSLQKRYSNAELKSLGGAKINVEQLLSLEVDVVFAGIFDAEGLKNVEHMRSLGIKVILVSEFLERKPLDKTFWLKFYSNFYEDEKMEFADSLYDQISSNYYEIKQRAAQADVYPEVMTGLPWKGNWFIPGGESFQSRYFEDAAAKYIFEDNDDINSFVMDFESMFEKGLKVPFWLNVSDVESLKEIKDMDGRFVNFRAYKQKNVYNNNVRKNIAGGNDYWESGAVRADWILKDLAAIFHPELFQEHSLFYYQNLSDELQDQ